MKTALITNEEGSYKESISNEDTMSSLFYTRTNKKNNENAMPEHLP